jgi:hypothetical protein
VSGPTLGDLWVFDVGHSGRLVYRDAEKNDWSYLDSDSMCKRLGKR